MLSCVCSAMSTCIFLVSLVIQTAWCRQSLRCCRLPRRLTDFFKQHAGQRGGIKIIVYFIPLCDTRHAAFNHVHNVSVDAVNVEMQTFNPAQGTWYLFSFPNLAYAH